MTNNDLGATAQPPISTGQPVTPLAPTEDAPNATPPETRLPRNVLALVALIVSLVGFVFACVPGALIAGWILLPIAFILAIVSLFMKGRGKSLGIAALIISIVGTIVGVVVFLTVVSTSFDEAFGGTDVTVQSPGESSEAETDSESGDESAAAGTRENPVEIGSEISSDDWTVIVNSYNADGGPTVSANQFNDAAPAGSHYEIVNYTTTYKGADSSLAALVSVDLVTAAGNVVNSYDNFVLLDDAFGLDELFAGASATGSVAFLVPDGQDVVIRVRAGMLTDEVFVSPKAN